MPKLTSFYGTIGDQEMLEVITKKWGISASGAIRRMICMTYTDVLRETKDANISQELEHISHK